MVQIVVSYANYQIFASIFKAGHCARFNFTYNDFHKAMLEIGFEVDSSENLVAHRSDGAIGNALFSLARIGGKVQQATKVNDYIQDRWKRELSALYGWEASTSLLVD
ncbi:hypothetical protein BD310DRAFT_982183 [Dichomitus squalens]|uniref:Uncharacterized protein n=1 Tax=Dichomitus squalens TaxID=114155 RepID=A0A4Q9PFL0_9APHY|nr:hypothetical protein BD310DRAFT_982183 [Dichomitus squalens]